MGDRICLSFVNDKYKERSPCLYAHWDGMDLLKEVDAFWECNHEAIRDEPANVLVNFISYIREGKIVDGGYYLYQNEDCACSPDDNGFWEFDTETGEYREYRKHDWEKE